MIITACLGLCGTCLDCNSLLFLSSALKGVRAYICVCVCMYMYVYISNLQKRHLHRMKISNSVNFYFITFLLCCFFGLAHWQCARSNGLIPLSVTHLQGLPGRIRYGGVSGCRKSCLNVSARPRERSADSRQRH